MRSWLFGVLLSESAERAPDAELLAVVATILHDLGLTDRYAAENRFEVDGANAARSFLQGRGISTQQMQVVWDAIALHTTRSIALHKEPEVAMTHSGITADVLGAGLDRIPRDNVEGYTNRTGSTGHMSLVRAQSSRIFCVKPKATASR